jgi:uncharacterized protein involved in type VI secretion and phage assembly
MNSLLTLPNLVIELDGAPLPAQDARALTQVRVQQRLSLPTLCELTFSEPDGPMGNAVSPAMGASLRVATEDCPTPLFEGELTALEYDYEPSGGRIVRLRGYDRLHRLRKRQPVRAHVQVDFAGLARELVADLGFSVEAAEAGPLRAQIIQSHQSDLELLRECGERCGLYFTLRGEVLHVLTLDGTGEPALPLELGDSLLEARLVVNGDAACRTVSASGWDPLRVERHGGQASASRVERGCLAGAPPESVNGAGERALVDEIVQNDAQAEALAQAELDRRGGQEVTLRGVAQGDPRLRPGVSVALTGAAATLAGRYALTSVDHTIDPERGFLSELSTVPPVPPPRDRGAVAALGIITRVDDPDHLGRVKASLPAYQDVETGWMSVLAAGAGKGKGLIMLPGTGDRVLLLFAQGDPAQGVVLGGLTGANGAPDWGVVNGAARRFSFKTPGGQSVQFNDAGGVARLSNAAGSFVELSPLRVKIHAAANLEIEAPGRAVVVRGETIDFQRG